MNAASPLATAVFLATVMIVLAAAIAGLVRIAPTGPGRGKWILERVVALILVWLVVPGILAARGMLARFDAVPPPALGVVLVTTLATIGLAFSGLGARAATVLAPEALVGYQAFRIAVEWWLHRMAGEGLVPVVMTWSGRNLDVVTGVSAVLVALALRARRGSRELVLAWNLLGLGLLINIVIVAVLSMPVPFRHFLDEPPNRLPGTFPWVWLPTFLVQGALFGHLLVLRRYLGRRAG